MSKARRPWPPADLQLPSTAQLEWIDLAARYPILKDLEADALVAFEDGMGWSKWSALALPQVDSLGLLPEARRLVVERLLHATTGSTSGQRQPKTSAIYS